MDDAQRRRRTTRRLWLAAVVLAVLLAGLIVPPMISIGRYKARITELMSESLGRPVHLSSVELRLLPRPEFVLTNLTVEGDPAYGAEPVLYANTVTAAIELLPLWQGRLVISSISVDEASLNLVRTQEGRWNLDSLFRTAAAHSKIQGQNAVRPLPYLEATNSRVNIMNGLEKLPFSLVDADLSFWQSNPGEWRVRLRGQPARTDVSLDLADTGVVELEASMRRAPELSEMPIQVDMEWKEAQLGQLSRLIVGSDPGWRGDLTADLHVQGTVKAAKVTARLRATGVHRAEFAPVSPLDFDVNCSLVYHYAGRTVNDLACDSPLGDGQMRLAGDLPGGAPPRLTLALQGIPVQAGLDLLRTLRGGIDEDLEARGTVSGELKYDVAAGTTPAAPMAAKGKAGHAGRRKHAQAVEDAAPNPLSGSLVVQRFVLRGGALRQPIQIPRITLEPAAATPGLSQALTTEVALPAGAASPLSATLRLELAGYDAGLQGPAALARLREWASVAGLGNAAALSGLSGDAAILNLNAQGPWLPAPEAIFPIRAVGGVKGTAPAPPDAARDRLSGTMEFHDVKWSSGVLASDLEVSQATLTLGGNMLVWDPVAFTYGPVEGTASLQVPMGCEEDAPCPPRLEVHFGELDAGRLEASLLGARKPNTLLSTLLAQLTSSKSTVWPQVDGVVKADSLALGPFTLRNVTATLQVQPAKADLNGFDAEWLGGQLEGSGTVTKGDKPGYALQGSFAKLSPQAVCSVLGVRCKGGAVSGDGKLEFSGFSSKDLSATAKGTLHFDWRRGKVALSAGDGIPAALGRFDRWTGEASIANGTVTLQQNQVRRGSHVAPVEATITFGKPPKVAFTPVPPVKTAKR